MRRIIIKYLTPTVKQKSMYLLIDMLIAALIAIPFSFFMFNWILSVFSSSINGMSNTGLNFSQVSTDFPFIITFIQYFSYFITWIIVIGVSSAFVGYTPGSRYCHIVLIDDEYNEPAGKEKRVKRAIISFLDAIFLLGLGSLSSVFNKESRTLADRVAHTKIAYEKRQIIIEKIKK
jgi:hypothetical protein